MAPLEPFAAPGVVTRRTEGGLELSATLRLDDLASHDWRLGLAVVIDKPFAPTAAEARQVIAAARAKRLPLSAYHIRRWDSESLTLRGLLEQGALGRVLRFESRLERWRPPAKGRRRRFRRCRAPPE